MLDDFIRRNKIQLINIILCTLIIVSEIGAMTIIGFEWTLLVILLIPLVEIVPGKATFELTLNKTKEFYESLDKSQIP